jgi:hypothetical protein
MIALLLLLLAQEVPEKVVCTSLHTGPVPISKDGVAVPMTCCPKGKWFADPNHPFAKNGKLLCTNHEEKT